MKNSNDTIGNRTRDLPACSAVPQPTAPPAACPILLLCPCINTSISYVPSPVMLEKSVFGNKFIARRKLKLSPLLGQGKYSQRQILLGLGIPRLSFLQRQCQCVGKKRTISCCFVRTDKTVVLTNSSALRDNTIGLLRKVSNIYKTSRRHISKDSMSQSLFWTLRKPYFAQNAKEQNLRDPGRWQSCQP